ncbi:MAG: hypothetical protein ABSD80_13525, partial [Caulobacteraceae bacterium]
ALQDRRFGTFARKLQRAALTDLKRGLRTLSAAWATQPMRRGWKSCLFGMFNFLSSRPSRIVQRGRGASDRRLLAGLLDPIKV